jgi:hypothetical protein
VQNLRGASVKVDFCRRGHLSRDVKAMRLPLTNLEEGHRDRGQTKRGGPERETGLPTHSIQCDWSPSMVGGQREPGHTIQAHRGHAFYSNFHGNLLAVFEAGSSMV